MESSRSPIVIGAGPAGLTAALRLVQNGVKPRLLEATGHVGGLARTPRSGEWCLDPGGHRFFTKYEEVLDLWNALLPPDQWLSVPRSSAMLVDGEYVRYPLVGRDIVTKLGLGRGLRGLGSFTLWRMLRGAASSGRPANFEEWGVHEFGRYWYTTFFDGYVRKTWLADPAELASDWANQRIKPIDWAWRNKRKHLGDDVFRYPRRGPGQLWDAAAAALVDAGVTPTLNARVERLWTHDGTWYVELRDGDVIEGDAVFSSMPLQSLVEALPEAPRPVQVAASALRHRGLITVAVALRDHHDIPFNWVYTPGAEFACGRIQNYGRWSENLHPPGWDGTFLGFEYFVRPDGDLMTADEDSLSDVVAADIRALGLGGSLIDHVMVLRSQCAYPVYDPVRERSVGRIRDYLRRQYPSLHPMGRNGMHRYDNQDHAMLSAMQSVAKYFGNDVDPWQVNVDREYHEAGLLKK
ncbi:protoporphyrinogen oxidase [Mycolicibacterium sp. P1-18]|uniref:FAD-dependent oxidoreductase n=1 Tax=Mycolicibacterium sp. P1-18 TaxID=2024615 RepID=UPI0011F1CCDC|nr:FAD-dependent oxidoreductase [Mycolicibacterium sp. P1-18]KAA0098819.1 protoporphyrinogen oxidase [Mycolicibacterium sp. P1-18]